MCRQWHLVQGRHPWSTSSILERFLGVFQKRKVLFEIPHVFSESCWHMGQCYRLLNQKKWQRWFWQELNWIHGLIYVVSSWKTPVVSNDISKSWQRSSNNRNSEFIYVKDAWLNMLRSYLGFLRSVYFPEFMTTPPFTSNCVELRVIRIYVVQRGTDLTFHDDLRGWRMCFLPDVFLYQLFRWSSVCSQKFLGTSDINEYKLGSFHNRKIGV